VALNVQAAEIKGARGRSAITTRNNRIISKIIKDACESRQKSQDRMAQQFSPGDSRRRVLSEAQCRGDDRAQQCVWERVGRVFAERSVQLRS
jgi:hypothetical protein